MHRNILLLDHLNPITISYGSPLAMNGPSTYSKFIFIAIPTSIVDEFIETPQSPSPTKTVSVVKYMREDY